MAEKSVKDARSEARLANNLCAETSKSVATSENKKKELALKLATADRERKSAKAGLKNAQTQAEKQRKKLYYTEIQLTTAN